MDKAEIRRRAINIVRNRVQREVKEVVPALPQPTVNVHSNISTDQMTLNVDKLTHQIDEVSVHPTINLMPNITVLPAEVTVQEREHGPPIVNVAAAQVHIDMAPVTAMFETLVTLVSALMTHLKRSKVTKVDLTTDSEGVPNGATISSK